MDPPLWTEGASSWAHEREALSFVRARLPNYEPYRAWTNVEFIAEDGSVNEVDLLVITTRGLFLVEIKSWPGALQGSGQRWRLQRPNGREALLDHPLLLANTKAKRLRSLLARQTPFRGDQLPWVTALVFLSSPALECRLDDVARTAVCGRDVDPLPGGAAPSPTKAGLRPLPGIVAVLKDPVLAGLRAGAINKPISARVAQALEQAGLKPSNRGRRAGDWELGELLDEGPGWQDFAARRPSVSIRRRVRVYLAGIATAADEEQRLRREAEREFRMVQDLRHDAIAQPLDLVQTERGPALLFDRVEGEERLDLWAPEHLEELPPEARLELLRQLVEAIAHAHARKVTHRGLTARSVLVRPSPGGGESAPRLVIGHWQAGARELATRLTGLGAETSGSVLGGELSARLQADEQVYLAPEAFTVDDPDGVALDVFSLGALAFLLLSGRPPASDLVEREAMLVAHRGLALDAVVDGVPDELAVLVSEATDPVPARRSTVRDLLNGLDEALDVLTAPTPAAAEPPARGMVDPLGAHQGDVLEGGWRVERRLGSGSTAVALLCSREGGGREVLKVAKDEDHAERVRDEARVLEQLRHAGIVELLGVERVGGRTTLRLAPAGDPDDKVGLTLAERLSAEGRLGLDLLERFGDDLLEILSYLESEGVAHRDLKPANLGVRPRRGDRSLHLVLFDFSLTRTSDANLQAGTPGYLDPFLAERPSRRWDPAADRYAAAATLHEMATGTRPRWGDGRTDPIHLDDTGPRLDTELFDPSVRDGLVAFFARALHRSPGERFDTAEQMRHAWRSALSAARPTTTDETGGADTSTLDRLAEAAGADTPVAELGLSGAATAALERLGLATVGQLLAFPTIDWNRTPGVGLQVRREVLEAIGRLRDHLDVDAGEPAASIDRLAGDLLAKPTTPQAQADHAPLELLLGLHAGGAQGTLLEPAQAVGAGTGPPPAWPGSADVKARCGLDRAAYEAMLDRARARWARRPPITGVRQDLGSILDRAGGVLSGDELAMALLAQRGSVATGRERLARARAVVRAALEVEMGRSGNRFTWRRLSGGASTVVALRSGVLDGEELADYAASLGVIADQIAAADPLLTPNVSLDRLRQVPTPAGLPPLSDPRLLRLAAAASATAAVSSRLELYPRGLAAARAVRLARGSLLGSGALSEEDVQARVRTRFPASEPLPPRPGLDELLRGAVGLEWLPEGQGPTGALLAAGFRVPRPPSGAVATALTVAGSRWGTGAIVDGTDESRAAAENTQDRLERHAGNGGYLVMSVHPAQQQAAVTGLAGLGATPLDCDALVIAALRRHATERHIKWDEAILTADTQGPAGPRWPTLLTAVRDALVPVRAELLTGPEHVLLIHPGLLRRYELLGLLDDLRERTTRHPDSGQTLRTLWVLVPAEDIETLPVIQGQAVPVTSSAERLALPDAWVRNLHRTRPSPTGVTS